MTGTNSKNENEYQAYMTYETVEELMNELESRRNWLHKLLGNYGYAHYNLYYLLFHPWKILEYWREEIEFAWQRVFRGWDDRVIWSIDSYLANMIPIWIKELKKNKIGVPAMMFDKDDFYEDEDGIYAWSDDAEIKASIKYDQILDEIIVGFEAYQELQDFPLVEGHLELEKKFNKAFKLFHEYFGTFWD